MCVALYRRRRGRRRPIGGFRGLGAICPPLRCYLFICPPVIYGDTYVWIRVHISRPGHKNTSREPIRRVLLEAQNKIARTTPTFVALHLRFRTLRRSAALRAAAFTPFLAERSRCGQSREPSQPEMYCRSNRLESLLRKNIDEFCLRDITRDGSQSKSYGSLLSLMSC